VISVFRTGVGFLVFAYLLYDRLTDYQQRSYYHRLSAACSGNTPDSPSLLRIGRSPR
jgi:hypothetical protein